MGGHVGLMRPGIWLMQQVRYPVKFLTVMACMLLPMLLLTWQLWQSSVERSNTLIQEQQGVALLKPLSQIESNLSGLALLTLPGVPATRQRERFLPLQSALALWNKALDQVGRDRYIAAARGELQTLDAFRQDLLGQQLETAEYRVNSTPPAIQAIRADIYERSGLVLENSMLRFSLGQQMVVLHPYYQTQLRAVAYRLRPLSKAIPEHELTIEELGAMQDLLDRWADSLPILSNSYERSTDEADRDRMDRDDRRMAAQVQLLREVLQRLRNEDRLTDRVLLRGMQPVLNSMWRIADEAWQRSVRTLETHLQSALHSERQQQWALLGLVAFSLALAAYLFLAFYLCTMRDIHQLEEATARLLASGGGGGVNAADFRLTSRDELSRVSAAFLEFAYSLTEENARRRTMEASLQQEKVQAESAVQQLREAQDSLLESERLASLGGLVAGVAHEINTPVGVALTAASHLSETVRRMRELVDQGAVRKSDLTQFMQQVEDTASLISSNSLRAADLIRGFKEIAVDQTSEVRRKFDLHDYIEEVLDSLRPHYKRRPVHITLDCPEGCEMDSYPGAIAQVLTNLVMNALIHAFEPEQDGAILIRVTLPDEERIRLQFMDNGKGVAPEHVGHLFDPFFTTRRGSGGSGLGLNIVYNLVRRRLGGSIEVDSTPGQGCRFTMLLPRVAGQGE
ncbi:sensor histidine kinase [Leeia sp.]|uniref:sensor histidine kinase n=1 Tax=Leeia sp. TaxID=2884678 RepID=UPI0035B42749